ncbi:MAG: ribosome recycling factor [bacterium]
MEELDLLLEETEEAMKRTVDAIRKEFASIRTGIASVSLLDNIKVECYGALSPLNQIATISAPEPKLLMIQPWDKTIISNIEKAIYTSDLGLTPINDGKVIRLRIPSLTEERRMELAKLIGKLGEEGKVSIRRTRSDTNKTIQKMEKDKLISEDDRVSYEKKVQKLTDNYCEEIDELIEKKREELMKE